MPDNFSDSAEFVYLDPPCISCKRLTHIGGQDFEGWRCKAFGDVNIPWAILAREMSHANPIGESDRGMAYEPKEFTGSDGKYIVTYDGDRKALK